MRSVILLAAALLVSQSHAAEILWQEEFTSQIYSSSPNPSDEGKIAFFPRSAVNTDNPDLVWNVPLLQPNPNGPRITYYVDETNAAAQGFDWQAFVDYLAATEPIQAEACFVICAFKGPSLQRPIVPGRLEFWLLHYRIEERHFPALRPYWHTVSAGARLFDNAGGPYPPFQRTGPEPSSATLAWFAICYLLQHRHRPAIASSSAARG